MEHNFLASKQASKQASISIIRFIALVCIVACHILQWLGSELACWFNVGVQIFLCISGFLYGQKQIGEVTKFYFRRFKKILVPYYIVFIPYGILQFMFAREVFDPMLFVRGLFLNATIKGAGHFWFVSTILLCYVLTPLLSAYRTRYIKDQKSLWLFSVFALLVAVIFFGAFNDFYNPAWICCYIVGYLIGINEKARYVDRKAILAIFGIAAVAGNGMQIYCEYIAVIHFKGWTYFRDFNHVMLGVFLFLLLKTLFEKANLKKESAFIRVADRYSYEVYLVHHLIILGPFSLMAITGSLLLNIFIIAAATCVLPWTTFRMENLLIRTFSRRSLTE